MTRRRHSSWAAALVLLTVGCSSGRVATPALPGPTPTVTSAAATKEPTPTATDSPQVHRRPVAAALSAYGDCRRLRQSVRREALAEVTAYGLGHGQIAFGGVATMTRGTPVPAPAAAAPMAGGTTGGGTTGGAGFSTTNNQEVDVDEPDLVKTDGTVLLVARQNPPTLQVVDVTGSRPRLRGALALRPDGLDVKLFLLGRTTIALGTGWDESGATTAVQVVDLADLDHPRAVRSFEVHGAVLDARLVKQRVVLAVQDQPQVALTYPMSDGPTGVRRALLVNRRLVAAASDQDWLPVVTVRPGGAKHRTDCSQALHPGVPSGLGTTTLVTIDPARDKPMQTLTVVGTSTTLYASTDRLYLATTSWKTQQGLSPTEASTDLHGFDLSDPDRLRFLGSGSVPGTLLDQYALSSYEGDLRVATTVVTGGSRGPIPASDSRVIVLRLTDGVLLPVGQVAGLGRGERIYGVRFLGALGYVVTFRETDPLYVVDLSDPARPRVRGELELTGYSSTLYPLDGHRLLGVGQSVDTQVRQTGLQLSVFDVSRPAAPRLQAKQVLTGAHSLAETNQHALLWWAPARLLVMPMTTYANRPFEGAIVMRVGTDGTLAEAWRLAPPHSGDQLPVGPQRSLVVGDLLYSVTDQGLITNRIDELSAQAWLPFT